MKEKRNTGVVWAVVATALLVLLGAYVAGYLLRSELATGYETYRVYDSRWEAIAFCPATMVESKLMGKTIKAAFLKRNRLTGQRTLDTVP